MSNCFRFLPALLCCAAFGIANQAHCQTGNPNVIKYKPKNNKLQMTGSANAPVNSLVTYPITQTDLDTWIEVRANDTPTSKEVQMIDTTCKIKPNGVTSFKNFNYALRGVNAAGTFTWDVIGTAMDKADTYVDSWTLYNDLPVGSLLLDQDFNVKQVVLLIAPAVAPPAPPTPPNPVTPGGPVQPKP